MSAQSFLYGLYPLGTGPPGSIYGTEVDMPRPYSFQPVPIHTENTKRDHLLYAYKNCPLLKELVSERKPTEEWKAKEIETQSFRERLTQQLGAEVSLSKISGVYHSLKAEMVHKRTSLIEFGLNDDDFRTVEKLKNWVLARKYYTRRTGQIGSGILLNSIVEQMEYATNSPNITPKFIYYSGHDGTLLSLFAAMGLDIDSFDIPHYSSYIIFELHEYNSNYYVHVEYNGKPITPRYNNITLTEFKGDMKKGFFTEEEYKISCQESLVESRPSSQPIQTLIYYFSYLFIFLLGYFLAGSSRNKSQKQQ